VASPLVEFFACFDRLDTDACAAMFAEHGRLWSANGNVAEGRVAVRECLREAHAELTSATHVLREQWHQGHTWIGQLDARYVLVDQSIARPVSQVAIMRMAPDGVEDLRAYAAIESSLHEARVRRERDRDRGLLVAGHWLPPL
jgi:hypothetical protein